MSAQMDSERAMLINKDVIPGAEVPKRGPLTPFLFLFASSLDLIGTTLAGIGLLYTYASIAQMLRGSIIVFSGILSVIFLKRKFYAYNWLGIGITTTGLLIVGVSSVIGESGGNSTRQLLIGTLLIVAGQLANAVQMVVEEVYLKKYQFAPLLVVGSEGLWGVLMMSAIVLPILYAVPGSDDGHYESAIDAAVMIKNNWVLLVLCLVYWLSIAFYNFCGLSVAKQLTAVHRTFIDACRTICVWGVEILLFYATKGSLGEPLNKWSLVQLLGFLLLLLGTWTYNAIVKFPCLYYPPPAPVVQR